MSGREVWGDAEVSFPDWKGTAQLDQRMTGPDAILEEVVGLDHDKWQVVGIDIGGGENSQSLHVLAVPRGVSPLVNDDGEIHVTDFEIHNVDPYDILRRITHVFELRLRTRYVADATILIVDRSDVPEGGMEWTSETGWQPAQTS